MENNEKSKKFLETPFELQNKKEDTKTLLVIIGVLIVISAILCVIVIGIEFALIILAVFAPFLLIYLIFVLIRNLKYKNFVKNIYSLGLDKEIEKGIILDRASKICLTNDHVIYNDYYDIIESGNKKYKVRSFYVKINDISKVVNKYLGRTFVCILYVGFKKYIMRSQDYEIVCKYLREKSVNKNIEIVQEAEIEKKDERVEIQNYPFKHEIYGDVNASIYEEADEYEGASVLFHSQDKSLSIVVGLPKNIDPRTFLENDNFKKQVLNYYYEFISNNLDVCKKHFVEKESDTIYDWITDDTPDIESNEFYTKNKTKPEFKRVLLEKMTLDVDKIIVDDNCKITFIEFSPSLNKYRYVLTLYLSFDVKNGKADLDSMFTDYVS